MEKDIDDEYIDSLKLPAALKLAKERNISISGLADLEEIKCQLKKHLLPGRRLRNDVIDELMKAAEEDSRVRHELIKIYQKTIDSFNHRSPEDPLIRNVSKFYKNTNCIDMLKKQKGKLDGKISRCPILVLGDTGAGKSSFINLLLGQEVFPISLLSNTSLICEISYSDVPITRLYPHDDEDDSVTTETIQAEKMEDFDFDRLSTLVQERDEYKKRSKFQKAEIGFPLPILKTGLIIVDSPGIGDTPEMTQLVLDYLIEASAFVFIINTIDGVQISRLEMLLEQLVKRVMTSTSDKHYRPDCTMFICNKWDQVPTDERTVVRKDAEKKLEKAWIGFKPSQLKTLSTKEALWIQRDGYIVGRFEEILHCIISLLPPSRVQLLTMSTLKLFEFLNNCMYCIQSNIHHSDIKPEDVQKQQLDANNKMESLKKDVIEFFKHQKLGLKSSLAKIAEDLSKHLRTPNVKNELGNFNSGDSEFTNRCFKEVTIVIRSRVYDRLSREIKEWEEREKRFEEIGKILVERFNEKFPEFNAQLFQAEKLFRSSSSYNRDTNSIDSPMDNENQFVPDVITDHFNNLNLGLKVILSVALSPVFLIGAIVRLPYWGIKQLGNLIKNEMLKRSFESGSDPDIVIKEYTEYVITKMTEKTQLVSCLSSQLSVLYQYMDTQMQKVLEQIDGKLKILNSSAEDCLPQFNTDWIHSKSTVDVLLQNLEFFNMMFLPENVHFVGVDKFEITKTLSKGSLTEILIGRDRKTDKIVGIRRSKIPVDMDRIRQYQKEEKCYRTAGKPHLVLVDIFIKDNMDIWQCFSHLPKYSLRQYIKEKNHKQYDDSMIESYYTVLSQVAKGLRYLHEKCLVHIDLSQDTVMIDSGGEVILVNISCPSRLDKALFNSNSVADFVHFSEDIIISTGLTVYESKHDMYSLGILMWELWSQQSAFMIQLSEKKITDLQMFSDYLKVMDVTSLLPPRPAGENLTSLRNIWQDVIVECLTAPVQVTASKWLDAFIKEYPPDNGHSELDLPTTALLYSRMH